MKRRKVIKLLFPAMMAALATALVVEEIKDEAINEAIDKCLEKCYNPDKVDIKSSGRKYIEKEDMENPLVSIFMNRGNYFIALKSIFRYKMNVT